MDRLRYSGAALGLLGVAGMLLLHWQVFFWVPTEATLGISQRIFYVHVPGAWIAFLAFGIVAITSAMYLWLRDERLDMVALAAAEGGMVFATVMITSGPIWARVAWGTWWTWEPRLTLTLLLWFVYLGYFMVRGSAENPERGKRFAAVVGILGAFNIPLIHMSVIWFRSLHPQPVVMKPEGPSLHPDMAVTLMTALLTFSLLFAAGLILRYALEHAIRGIVPGHISPHRSASDGPEPEPLEGLS